MSSSALPKLIGVIHLPALAGAPDARGLDPAEALQRAGLLAVREAVTLAKAGFDGLMIENFGDTPFYKDQVPSETVASMAVLCAAVREAIPAKVQLGVNILRNDAFAALGVAAVTGCQMMRVNVLSGLAATDQGMIEGNAARLIRERDRLGADDVAILADVHVKHARTLSSEDIALAVEETALRARADAVIVTGATTGRAVDLEELKRVGEIARAHGISVLIGSGATPENLPELLPHVSGIIVGSALRRTGKAGAPLDPARIRQFVQAFKKAATKASRKGAQRARSKTSAKSVKPSTKKKSSR